MFASVFSGSRIVLGHSRRSAEMQPTGDLISGYFYLSSGLQVASRDADTTGTTLHFVSRLKIAATKRRCLWMTLAGATCCSLQKLLPLM